MQVPAFLLRRLYVKGSLRNEAGGWAFDLANSLGTGYADRVLPLLVDGDEMPPERCTFVVDGERIGFGEISEARPMTLPMHRTLTVVVDGVPLPPGEHTVEMGFMVTGMGEMRFDVKDAVADA